MRTDRHWLHQKVVTHARAHGINATAREFGCSRNTVRKWWRRAVPGKPSSLAEKSRAPKHCPHKTSAGLEGQIVKLRKRTGFGAERLVHEFDLNVSHNAVARIIRQHGLTRPRKKKPAVKKQLRMVKRAWKLFGQLSADTKFLQDIPCYWIQMVRLGLPRFQYRARDCLGRLFHRLCRRALQKLRRFPSRTTQRPSGSPWSRSHSIGLANGQWL